MSGGIEKKEVISLLRKLLRVSMNMFIYNFRDYSKRRIMYEFKCNKDNNDVEKSVEKHKWGSSNMKYYQSNDFCNDQVTLIVRLDIDITNSTVPHYSFRSKYTSFKLIVERHTPPEISVLTGCMGVHLCYQPVYHPLCI